jgi:hypothetical protein
MFKWLCFWRRSNDDSPAEAFLEAERRLSEREGDDLVKELLPYRAMSPEEYAARHGHGWGVFSFHLYRYRDPALGDWVRRLGEILHDGREMERCRRRHLSPEEYVQVQQEIEDILEHGL